MKIQAWSEVTSNKRYLGLLLWLTGGEIRIGRRTWRWRLEAGRELCHLLRRHDPVTIIDKAHPLEMTEDELGLYVLGRIEKQHKECYRCKKRLEDK